MKIVIVICIFCAASMPTDICAHTNSCQDQEIVLYCEGNTLLGSIHAAIIRNQYQFGLGMEPPLQDDSSRNWKVIKLVAEALNTNNLELFNSYFANLDYETIASNKSIFNFFADEVIPLRGKIIGFHSLNKPFELSDTKYLVHNVTFHLEEGFPGSISIALDQNDKIDHFSLFVQRQTCTNGIASNCPLIKESINK